MIGTLLSMVPLKLEKMKIQKDMVEKSKNLLLKTWIAKPHVCENYNADNGRGGEAGTRSNAFYHGGALLGFIDMMDKGYVPSYQFQVK